MANITENDILRIAYILIDTHADYTVETYAGTMKHFSGADVKSKLEDMLDVRSQYPTEEVHDVIEYIKTLLLDGNMHFAKELTDSVKTHYRRTYNSYVNDFSLNRMIYILNNYLEEEIEVDRTRSPYMYYLKTAD